MHGHGTEHTTVSIVVKSISDLMTTVAAARPKPVYYDGIINDAKDSVEYSDWSDARGDAYSWWSETRGEVYSNWSDTRGDLHSFYSDMRSELYSGDTDGASNELQDFKDKVVRPKYGPVNR